MRLAVITAACAMLATCGDKSAAPLQPAVIPSAPVLTTLLVATTAGSITVGQTMTASASGLDQNGASIGTGPVSWSSSVPAVASIDAAGLVAGLAPGRTQIVAAAGGKQGQAAVTVVPVAVASLTIVPPTATLVAGATSQLTATPLDAAGHPLPGRAIAWTSSDSSKARVSVTGLVTAVATGTASITATSEGKSASAVITVVAPSSIRGVSVVSLALGAQLYVRVDGPTQVLVRYRDTSTGRIVELTRLLSRSDSSITLMRLVYGHAYHFSVFAVQNGVPEATSVDGDFTAPALPADLADVKFSVQGTPTGELCMWEVQGSAGFKGFVATDAWGDVVWFYRTVGAAHGGTIRANGNFVLNDLGTGLLEVTPAGAVVHKADIGAHHDAIATPANTVLFISFDVRSAAGTGTLWGDGIFEWTPETGEVVERFSEWDFFDPRYDWGTRSSTSDWLHANSLAIGPHGNVLLSLDWTSEVVSIAPDWRSIEWHLGGRRSTFAFDSGAAFSGQHTVTMPAENRVLLFDNGREFTGAGRLSRGLELQLSTTSGRATAAWSFSPSPANYAPYLGYARRLSNGNTELLFGLPQGQFNDQVATGPISAFEVSPSGATIWRTDVTNSTSVYRAWQFSTIGGEHAAH
jgi:hypothetical protein